MLLLLNQEWRRGRWSGTVSHLREAPRKPSIDVWSRVKNLARPVAAACNMECRCGTTWNGIMTISMADWWHQQERQLWRIVWMTVVNDILPPCSLSSYIVKPLSLSSQMLAILSYSIPLGPGHDLQLPTPSDFYTTFRRCWSAIKQQLTHSIHILGSKPDGWYSEDLSFVWYVLIKSSTKSQCDHTTSLVLAMANVFRCFVPHLCILETWPNIRWFSAARSMTFIIKGHFSIGFH